MDAMHVNTPSYALTVSTSSVSITLNDNDVISSSIVIYNEGTTPVFIVSGATAAPTAVYPTTGTRLLGKVIAPGATVIFQKGMLDRYIAAIRSTGSDLIHVAVGTGE